MGKNTTFTFDAVLQFSLRGGSERQTEFGLYPGLGADFRYYYNMDRRLGKGKNILGNSGNYVAVANQFFPGNAVIGNLDFNSDYYYNAAIVYGIQRMLPKGFYWGISFGPGIFVNYSHGDTRNNNVDADLFLDAKLGWVLGKRK